MAAAKNTSTPMDIALLFVALVSLALSLVPMAGIFFGAVALAVCIISIVRLTRTSTSKKPLVFSLIMGIIAIGSATAVSLLSWSAVSDSDIPASEYASRIQAGLADGQNRETPKADLNENEIEMLEELSTNSELQPEETVEHPTAEEFKNMSDEEKAELIYDNRAYMDHVGYGNEASHLIVYLRTGDRFTDALGVEYANALDDVSDVQQVEFASVSESREMALSVMAVPMSEYGTATTSQAMAELMLPEMQALLTTDEVGYSLSPVSISGREFTAIVKNTPDAQYHSIQICVPAYDVNSNGNIVTVEAYGEQAFAEAMSRLAIVEEG